MKWLVNLIVLISFPLFSQVGINNDGSTPDASSILDLKSTNSGILIPRMNQSQRDAINSPANGLMVFQIDNTPGFYYYDGSTWVKLTTGNTPGGNASGDLSGTYPSPTVAKINGSTLGTTTPTSGNLLIGNGTQWSSTAVSGDVTMNSSGVTTLSNTSNNYIKNGTTSQTADYNISGNGTIGTDLSVGGNGTFTGDANVNGSDINGPGINGGTNGILRINSNTDIRMVLDKDANGSQQFDIAPNGGATPVFTVTEAGNVTANGYVRMLEAGTTPTYYTAIQSGDLTGANLTLTLPNSAGTAGQFMQTNGSGTLSFYTLGGNVMSFYSGVLTSTSAVTSYTGNQTIYYNMPGGAFVAEGNAQVKMPKCQVTRMRIVFNSNSLNGSSTFTLRKNGSATAIAITQASATTTASESTGAIAFADGDLLSVVGVLGGTSGQTLSIVRIEITYYLVP